MIQDYAGGFVGRQAVRVRAIPIRENAAGRKIIGMVMTGATLAFIAISLVFCLLIRTVRTELAVQSAVKAGLAKAQQELYAERNALLNKDALVRSAGKLGLYVPEREQIRRL